MDFQQLFRPWKNAEAMTLRLESRGFRIPRRYRAFMAETIGYTGTEWDRMNYERADRLVRFLGQPDHESELWRKIDAGHLQTAMDQDFRNRCSPFISMWKRAEMSPMTADTENWSPKRSHLREIAQKRAMEEGFRLSRKGFIVVVDEDLNLACDVDVGRPGSTIQQFVLHGRLSKKDGAESMVVAWDLIVPEMYCYNSGENPEEMSWGIRAYITLAGIFAELVREARTSSQ